MKQQTAYQQYCNGREMNIDEVTFLREVNETRGDHIEHLRTENEALKKIQHSLLDAIEMYRKEVAALRSYAKELDCPRVQEE